MKRDSHKMKISTSLSSIGRPKRKRVANIKICRAEKSENHVRVADVMKSLLA